MNIVMDVCADVQADGQLVGWIARTISALISVKVRTPQRALRLPYSFLPACKCVVVTVDYRLAPEYPYPAAAEDAVEALQWLIKEATKPVSFNIDIDRIAIGGTSA